jgi:DNA-binding XRE family transcriptional regulator
MLSPKIGFLLRDWRKANGVKQESLAALLGVSQSAVSHWENERDIPNRRLVGRIVDIIMDASNDRLCVDHLAIRQHGTMRASFDLDGVKLVMASKGLTAAWPEFSKLADMRLAERLVGEASHFMHDEDFVRSARRGEVAMISAVSDKHVQMDMDIAFRHRWIAVFRSYGARMLIDMTYEACDPLSETGVQSVTHFDSIAA